MYFNDFPLTQYDCSGDGNLTTIQDLLTRIKVRNYIRNNGAMFAKHSVRDGETPEMVSNSLYGTPTFHWILLLFNEITNTYYEWPLSRKNFQAYVIDKYTNPDATHHYEVSQSSSGDWVKIRVESDVAGAVAVTNTQYEANLQDKKREIKILQPQFVDQFRQEFNTLLESSKV